MRISLFLFLLSSLAAEEFLPLPPRETAPLITTEYFYTKTTIRFPSNIPSIGWGYRNIFNAYFGHDFFMGIGYYPRLAHTHHRLHAIGTVGNYIQYYPTKRLYFAAGLNIDWLYPSSGYTYPSFEQQLGYKLGKNHQYFVECSLAEGFYWNKPAKLFPPSLRLAFGFKWDE